MERKFEFEEPKIVNTTPHALVAYGKFSISVPSLSGINLYDIYEKARERVSSFLRQWEEYQKIDNQKQKVGDKKEKWSYKAICITMWPCSSAPLRFSFGVGYNGKGDRGCSDVQVDGVKITFEKYGYTGGANCSSNGSAELSACAGAGKGVDREKSVFSVVELFSAKDVLLENRYCCGYCAKQLAENGIFCQGYVDHATSLKLKVGGEDVSLINCEGYLSTVQLYRPELLSPQAATEREGELRKKESERKFKARMENFGPSLSSTERKIREFFEKLTVSESKKKSKEKAFPKPGWRCFSFLAYAMVNKPIQLDRFLDLLLLWR